MFDGTGHYYAYGGSLTTPTCNEVVTWVVLEVPKVVTPDTLDKMKVPPPAQSAHASEENPCCGVGLPMDGDPVCPQGDPGSEPPAPPKLSPLANFRFWVGTRAAEGTENSFWQAEEFFSPYVHPQNAQNFMENSNMHEYHEKFF